MKDFEKLGAFYLGRAFDPAVGKRTEELLLYDSKDLTTHALCVGMTGSGKTGLCLSLLEEAGIDGVPALAIDPKGDLGSLFLTFPGLKPRRLPTMDQSGGSGTQRNDSRRVRPPNGADLEWRIGRLGARRKPDCTFPGIV